MKPFPKYARAAEVPRGGPHRGLEGAATLEVPEGMHKGDLGGAHLMVEQVARRC